MRSRQAHARRVLIAYNLLVGPLFALALIARGNWPWAIAAILIGHAFWMYSTLVPHCGWFGEVVTTLKTLDPNAKPEALWLTIDDGPHPDDTPLVLDLLDAHSAKATFFFIGENAAAHPELVREVAARGHQVGNHTMTHPHYRFWSFGPKQIEREIKDCDRILEELTDVPVRYVRAPAGLKNPFLQSHLESTGRRLIGWSARGLDGVSTDRVRILGRLKAQTKAGGILLLHEGRADSEGRRIAPDVLRGLLEALRDRGLHCALPGIAHR
jgi:peptidoglycan/xylan/chitin deacetylase (PgdA/CDA1 family)